MHANVVHTGEQKNSSCFFWFFSSLCMLCSWRAPSVTDAPSGGVVDARWPQVFLCCFAATIMRIFMLNYSCAFDNTKPARIKKEQPTPCAGGRRVMSRAVLHQEPEEQTVTFKCDGLTFNLYEYDNILVFGWRQHLGTALSCMCFFSYLTTNSLK